MIDGAHHVHSDLLASRPWVSAFAFVNEGVAFVNLWQLHFFCTPAPVVPIEAVHLHGMGVIPGHLESAHEDGFVPDGMSFGLVGKTHQSLLGLDVSTLVHAADHCLAHVLPQ